MSRLAIALSLLLFVSCKKDSNNYSLVGAWRAISFFNGDIASGGCNCWKDLLSLEQHTVTFRADGTYTFKQPMIASASGCSGNYQKTSDSTLTWNMCGVNTITDRFYFEGSFLIMEQGNAGGLYKNKYRRD